MEEEYYIATRKETGAHFLFHGPNYLEQYEREFERIREFADLDEAKKALAARESVEHSAKLKALKEKQGERLKVGKLRGDITKGSVEDEELRAKIRAELEEELRSQIAETNAKTSRAKVGPKTAKRSA